MAELRFQTWHVDTRVLFQDLTKDVHQERVFSSAMELAFDIIMDPAQSQTARLRPGQPVTPSMLDLARRKLEDHRNSELRDGLPPWRILSERFSILEPELKARCLSIPRLELLEFCGPLQSQEWSSYALGPDLDAKLQALLPAGLAALAEDPALALLRSQLVPARVSELAFFFCYFVHVKRHRRDVLPPMAQVISSEEEWENFLTRPLRPPSPPPHPAGSGQTHPSSTVQPLPPGWTDPRSSRQQCAGGRGGKLSERKVSEPTQATPCAVGEREVRGPTEATLDDDEFDEFLNSSI